MHIIIFNSILLIAYSLYRHQHITRYNIQHHMKNSIKPHAISMNRLYTPYPLRDFKLRFRFFSLALFACRAASRRFQFNISACRRAVFNAMAVLSSLIAAIPRFISVIPLLPSASDVLFSNFVVTSFNLSSIAANSSVKAMILLFISPSLSSSTMDP